MNNAKAIVWGTSVLLSAFMAVNFLPSPEDFEATAVYSQSNKFTVIADELSLNLSSNGLNQGSAEGSSAGPYTAPEKDATEYFNHSVFIGHSIIYGFAKNGQRDGTPLQGARFDCAGSANTGHTAKLIKGEDPGLNNGTVLDGDISKLDNVKYIFYMMDANEASNANEKLFNDVMDAVDLIRQAVPDAKIHILDPGLACLQTNYSSVHKLSTEKYRDYLKTELAKRSDIYYIDTYRNLIEENNGFEYLKAGGSGGDGLHLSPQSYKESWIPVLTEWATNVTTKQSTGTGSSGSGGTVSKEGVDPSISWGKPVELPHDSVPGKHYSAEEKSFWTKMSVTKKLPAEVQYENGYSYLVYNGYKYYLCAISARVSLSPGVDPDYTSISNKDTIPYKYGMGHIFILNFEDGTSLGVLPVDSKANTGNGWGHPMAGPGGNAPSVIEFAAADEGRGANGQPFLDKNGPVYNKQLKSVQKGPDVTTGSW